MAGVKGRSGGKRPGAGRKPRTAAAREAEAPAPEKAPPAKKRQVRAKSPPGPKTYEDPISYLRDVVNDPRVADSTRVIAARSWAQLENARVIVSPKAEPKGKKERQKEAAAEQATGSSVFAMRPPPRLVG